MTIYTTPQTLATRAQKRRNRRMMRKTLWTMESYSRNLAAALVRKSKKSFILR